jgi:hypothetical protein
MKRLGTYVAGPTTHTSRIQQRKGEVSMRMSISRAARFAAVAALPIAFMAAKPVADGMSYEFVMKTTGKATGNKEQITMRGTGVYAGDNARIEILEASASAGGEEIFGGKGSYFVVKGGGQEMFLVSPKDKTYMKWDMASMFAGMSKVVNAVGGLVKMQMSDIKIDAQDMGAGPTIHGYPTKHIRMIQNYTMSASVFGRKSNTRTETTTDIYIAPTLRIPNPFVSNSEQMAMMSQLDMFNNPDYKNQMAAANAKMPKSGVPLRTETKTVSTDDKGKAETTTSVMEMINFKSGNIPASTFVIPTEYTMVEMPNLDASLAGNADGKTKTANGPVLNADSVANAAKQGAADGVKESVKAGAKDAATKKIKGIFGGKKN